jgi:hypothetical protein
MAALKSMPSIFLARFLLGNTRKQEVTSKTDVMAVHGDADDMTRDLC